MGRAPCCSKVGLHRGAWSDEEDKLLTNYIQTHGEGQWRSMPSKAGLLRCGKSCRLRWMNYLRPGIKRGNFTPEEEENIIRLHSIHGSRWSFIASELSGRTDNEIKNYWNSHLKRKLAQSNQPEDVSKTNKKTKEKKKRKTDQEKKLTKVVKITEKEAEEEKVVSHPASSSSSSLLTSSKSESSSSAVDQGETDFCWPNWSPLLEMEGASSQYELELSLDGLDSLMMEHDDGEMLEKLYDECWMLIQDGDGEGLNHKEVKQIPVCQENIVADRHPVWGRLKWQIKEGGHSDASYADILKNDASSEKKEKEIVVLDHKLDYIEDWERISLIGKAKDAQIFDSLIEVLEAEDVPLPQLRFMGGLNALMTFHDEEETEVFYRCLFDRGDIFERIDRWQNKVWEQERVIILKIYGVPPPLWGEAVFEDIGNKFGKVIMKIGADGCDVNLAFKKVRILSDCFEPIDEVCSIKWEQTVFRCRVKESDEEWLPDFVRHQDGIGRRTPSMLTPAANPVVVGGGDVSPEKDPAVAVEDVGVDKRLEGKSTIQQGVFSVQEKDNRRMSGDIFLEDSRHTDCRESEDFDVGTKNSRGPVDGVGPMTLLLKDIGLLSSDLDSSQDIDNSGPAQVEDVAPLISNGPVLRSRSRLGGTSSCSISATIGKGGKKGKSGAHSKRKAARKVINDGRSISDPVATRLEVEETIKMGESIGVRLIGEEGKVEEVVVGDNYSIY
ncbi:hypothetical protein SSX86_004967 [Deinandra increscens subsp. villosa]|uniref:Uncharacterized protein n=1 Tax=Deinandra increscens subsp. villosa TaxID=3103831 RepID=A0AAP0H6G1_9ASTR